MRGICDSCGGTTYKGNALCCRCMPRREPLTPEQRSESARESARARWSRPRPAPEPIGHRAGDHTQCDLDEHHGVCSECGKTVQIGRSSAPPERRRCRDCQRANPKKPQLDPRVCEQCGVTYVPKPAHRPDQRFHSKSCAQTWRNRTQRPSARPDSVSPAEWDRTRQLAKSRARRTRHQQTWDGITDDEILERDGWRCQIPGCRRRPIRKDLKYPHPRSRSVDHIIPLSFGVELGGIDTAENKRAAHLGCNMARGNHAGDEQIALFGSIREAPLAKMTADERAAMFKPRKSRRRDAEGGQRGAA